MPHTVHSELLDADCFPCPDLVSCADGKRSSIVARCCTALYRMSPTILNTRTVVLNRILRGIRSTMRRGWISGKDFVWMVTSDHVLSISIDRNSKLFAAQRRVDAA